MKLNEYKKKHDQGVLKEEEWEQMAQQLLNAKFDKELGAEWEKKLQAKGVYRTPPIQGSRSLRTVNIRQYLSVAAVFLLIAAGTWFMFFRSPLSPTQQLASSHLEQPFRMNSGNTRGDDSIEKNRGMALEAFSNRQYEKSLNYLQKVESEGQAKASDYFQMGLCLMYQVKPDYQNALKMYDLATASDAMAYQDEIHWFSALCQLMLGQNQAAKSNLEKVIASKSSRNQLDAQKILDALL